MSEQQFSAADRAYFDTERNISLDELPEHIERLGTMAEWWIGEAERLRDECETLRSKVEELEAAFDDEGEPDDDAEDCRSCDGDGWVCAECDSPMVDCECEELSQVPCPDCEGTGLETVL